MTALAPTLQAFFTDRLVRERHASPATVAAYRDTWRMLLDFAATQSLAVTTEDLNSVIKQSLALVNINVAFVAFAISFPLKLH